jgi:hypothetical protein
MDDPKFLTNAQLVAALELFAQDERERMPWFLALLGEGDRRNSFVDEGYASTFDFCIRRLKLSEGETYRRIQAARAAVRRPELLSSMAHGDLSLSVVSKIAPHVHRKDAPEIISRAQGRSKREVEEILAPFAPEAAKRDRIRTVSVEAPSPGSAKSEIKAVVDFSFHGTPELRDAIDRAKDLLSHKYPFGGMNEILSEVVLEFLDRHDPQTNLALGRLAPAKGNTSIPAQVRRAVWSRDGGRCSFIGVDGVRCETRRMLELDHRRPRALGGLDTVENLRLLCRAHNDSERRRLLGEGDLSTDLARARSVDNLDFFRQ